MAAYIYSITDTWNNVATTWTGIGLNVTDTASAAGSKLMDLQVGGTTKFNVGKGGDVNIVDGIYSSSWMYLGGNNQAGTYVAVRGSEVSFRGGTYLEWSSGAAGGNLSYGNLTVPTAGQFHYNNFTTSSTGLHTYNTYTDGSNYERGSIAWSANVLTISTAAAGTGTRRNLQFDSANRSAYVASPTATQIRDLFISFGMMAPV